MIASPLVGSMAEQSDERTLGGNLVGKLRVRGKKICE